MRLFAASIFAIICGGSALAADSYQSINERDAFIAAMGGKNLSNRLYALTLTVTDDGQIAGRAVGSPVTGTWDWIDGFFCRQMDWGGTDIPYNCQLVEIRNGNQMRFTVDRGAGNSASFMLR